MLGEKIEQPLLKLQSKFSVLFTVDKSHLNVMNERYRSGSQWVRFQTIADHRRKILKIFERCLCIYNLKVLVRKKSWSPYCGHKMKNTAESLKLISPQHKAWESTQSIFYFN